MHTLWTRWPQRLSAASMTLMLSAACNLSDDPDIKPKPPGPSPATCAELTPVCEPGCGAQEACVFQSASGSCACQPLCDSTSPQCPGVGPRSGCQVDEVCTTSCTCQPVGCMPDAPVCEGGGPNAGCAAGQRCDATCRCVDEVIPVVGLLPRPSRSSSVDISADDSTVVMVNTDDGSLSVFDAAQGQRRAVVATSASPKSEPMAVVLSVDGKTAYVANRASGTVSRVVGVDGAQPQLQGELSTNGEPVGVALSPTGATLWVTDWVAGTVTSINTATFTVKNIIDVGGNPFALAVTNNGDQRDEDELVLVTQFFGRHQGKEAQDDGRVGVVHVIPAGASSPSQEILLSPKLDCFSGKLGGQDVTTACSPNQLNHITIHQAFGRTRAYVTSVAASPAGPVNFNFNVQALVSVIDVDALAEEPSRTVNLNALVAQQVDNDGDDTKGRRFMNMLNGIGFVNAPDRIIGYATSAASDITLRVVWDEAGAVSVGAPTALNIPVGQNPSGIVVKHGSVGTGAYVANLISRDLSFILFADQRTTQTISSTPVPAPGSQEFKVWRGKRFFNTSTGIWSKEGWGSCQGCHPMGLTDNITWSFAAGPRQSISMDGQYNPKNPNDMRALNWTAIFDETEDFELNTRGVSGGVGTLQNNAGPLTSEGPVVPFGALVVEDNATRENHQALNGSLRFIANSASVCTNRDTCPDFGLIDEYVKTIRSPRGKPADSALVARGRAQFVEGGCAKCHGGQKWTISSTFYDPTRFAGALPARTFAANAAAAAAMSPGPGLLNTDTTLIAGDDSDGGSPAFKRLACNVRDVGTFGAPGGAPEVRANGTPAQGKKGFNPPSLLGLNVGAPYLHHGAAPDLKALFGPDFKAHTSAGNPNFEPRGADLDALIAFLLSIDESTEPVPVPDGFIVCPTSFVP